MRPRQCLNGITLWGKAKDTTDKISIMQNQFPCINPIKLIAAITGMIMEVVLLAERQKKQLFCNAQYQLVNKAITTPFYLASMGFFHWPAFIVLRFFGVFFFVCVCVCWGGGGGGGLRYIRAYDFVYVFFVASFTSDFDFIAQNCSLYQAPNLCMHAIKWHLVIISYFIRWKFFDDIEKYFHNFKLISNSTAINPMGWTFIDFAAMMSHTWYRFIISYLGSISYFLSIILKRYPMRSILLPTQKQSITIDKNNFEVHTHPYVTNMGVIFAPIVF